MLEKTRAAMLEFIRDPDKWPMWPRLPLVRRGTQPDAAYLYGDPPRSEGPITLYIGNIYDRKNLPTEKQYSSIEAMLDDGWVVD